MWPPEAVEFLRELEANNDRDWFRANRSRYDRDLLAPARSLAEQLSDLGAPRFFRPYRDTRFRPGPPLKEHLGVGIGDPMLGGYYLELSLDGLLLGAGLHHPASDQLERFRRAIDDDRRARSFERAVAEAEAAGLELIAPDLKRAPKGYAATHPRIERLRMKRVTAFARHELGPWLHRPDCDRRVRAQLTAARPLVEWLSETIGPSTPPAPSLTPV
jgi:uncharacterized protein (TIGR02453 family)